MNSVHHYDITFVQQKQKQMLLLSRRKLKMHAWFCVTRMNHCALSHATFCTHFITLPRLWQYKVVQNVKNAEEVPILLMHCICLTLRCWPCWWAEISTINWTATMLVKLQYFVMSVIFSLPVSHWGRFLLAWIKRRGWIDSTWNLYVHSS